MRPPVSRNKSAPFLPVTQLTIALRTPSSPMPATQSFFLFKWTSKARMRTILTYMGETREIPHSA